MRCRFAYACLLSVLAGAVAGAAAPRAYNPPRTPWGDPQLEGVYSNDDETGVPFERPAQFEGRRIDKKRNPPLVRRVGVRKRFRATRTPAPRYNNRPDAG